MGQKLASTCGTGCQCDSKDNLLGGLVRRFVESYDNELIGVDVRVGGLEIHPGIMMIDVKDLKMDNPKGYKSDHLLLARSVRIDVDAMSLLQSRGKSAVLEDVTFEGVEFVYEPSVTTSNLKDVLNFINPEGERRQAMKQQKQEEGMKVTLQVVSIKQVVAKMFIKGFGPHLDLADITYADFDKEFGGVHAIMDVIRILLTTVMKSTIATILHNAAHLGIPGLNVANATIAANAAKSSIEATSKSARSLGSVASKGAGAVIKGAGTAAGVVSSKLKMLPNAPSKGREVSVGGGEDSNAPEYK